MTDAPSPRQRLIQAAFELFVAQGVTYTTTKEIALRASVNEVTLFRQFGNKYGLLSAVITESGTFRQLSDRLTGALPKTDLPIGDLVSRYASATLKTLKRIPKLGQSIVGEADQYPPETQDAFKSLFRGANQALADRLAPLLPPEQSSLAIAGLINSALLGYTLLGWSGNKDIWGDRAGFIGILSQQIESLASRAGVAVPTALPIGLPAGQTAAVQAPIQDLPAPIVHEILQRSRRGNPPDQALAYLLFGAGLSAAELVQLRRIDCTIDEQTLLHIQGRQPPRQIVVNQWILGVRYGSGASTPLGKWIKRHKDGTGLFLNAEDQPLTIEELTAAWERWTEGLAGPDGPLRLEQAAQTWRVEMLVRGLSLENLGILTGIDPADLQPYADRARQKLALEQALALDRKNP
jgi:AcrR family transcriptional regulator